MFKADAPLQSARPHFAPMNRTAEQFDYEAAVEACARGERFALRSLYERESRWLLAVAQRIVRDREVAREVLQDAFLQVWQRASTYQRALGSARGWIYTVVRHRALDAARRSGREIAVGDDLDAIADAAASTDTPDFRHGDAESLQHCLEALDEPRRNCVVLAFVEGYTQEQIAQQLAAPLGTVKSWIRRGLLSLKECLS